MAKVIHPLLEGLSGTFGDLVFMKTKNGTFVKAKPRRTNRLQTPHQLEQGKRFSMAVKFISSAKDLVRIGFSQDGRSAYNRAVKQLLADGIYGTFPELYIDYSKLQLSAGSLKNPAHIRMKATQTEITVSWQVLKRRASRIALQSAVLAIYCPETQCWLQSAQFKRSDGRVSYDVSDLSEKSPEVFLFFTCGLTGDASPTLYLGNVVRNNNNPNN